MPDVWDDACLAAQLFALDPAALGGICLHAHAGPVREAWLTQLREALPATAPVRRVPLHVADERLLGGLDLAATLRAERPVAERGLLAETDGGVLLLAMGERLTAAVAARLTAALDAGEVLLERDGLTRRHPCRAGFVILDEGEHLALPLAGERRGEGGDGPPAALLDRCAFLIDLEGISHREIGANIPPVESARAQPGDVVADDDVLEALAATAAALGVDSIRTVLLSLRAARAAAAFDGRLTVSDADIVTAARLVLAPRATTIPVGSPEAPTPESAEASAPAGADNDEGLANDASLGEIVLDAAKAAIPAGLLASLQSAAKPSSRAAPGRMGMPKQAQRRGRPIGTRRGDLSIGARLNVVETLRAAAPWQKLRRQQAPGAGARVLVQPSDFRITRFQQRTESTAIFVVDASGSAALNRLAEAKGAVELLLADCYVRRDQVALLAFRGVEATVLLPPTGSLVRAKRGLAGLAGGGGTPLASGLDHAAALADQVRRRGQTPFIIVLTDGRANIARDGTPGRARAVEDAKSAARIMRAAGYASLLIDTSPQPQPHGRDLAAEMGATYLPLPYADASALSQAVRGAYFGGGG